MVLRRVRYLVVALTLAVLSLGLHTWQATAAPESPDVADQSADDKPAAQAGRHKADEVTGLAKEQAAVARDVLRAIKQLESQGITKTHSYASDTAVWSRRLIESLRIAGEKSALAAALKDYVEFTKLERDRTREAVRLGLSGVTVIDLAETEYRLLESRRWLVEELGK